MGNATAHFLGDSRRIVIFGRRNSGTVGADVLALPDLSPVEQIATPGEALLGMHGDQLATVVPRAPKGSGADIFIRSFAGASFESLGFLRDGPGRIRIDASGDTYLISYPGDRQLFGSTLKQGTAGQRKVLRIDAPISRFWFGGSGERVALLDDQGRLYIATLAESRKPRQMPGPSARPGETVNDVAFDSLGHWLVAAVERQGLRMWDLMGPPDAEPLVLGRGGATTATTGVVFEPTGRWLTAEDPPQRGRYRSRSQDHGSACLTSLPDAPVARRK